MLRVDGGPGASQGAGTGSAGLTCIGVSQEGVLVLAAPQRDRRRRFVLWQPREAGDAHVVHGRVGAQGALLTGLVLRRHPRPRPPSSAAPAGSGAAGGRVGRGLISGPPGGGASPSP